MPKCLSEDDILLLRNWTQVERMINIKVVKPLKLSNKDKNKLNNYLCGWCDNELSKIDDCPGSNIYCNQESRNDRALKCLNDIGNKND